MSGLKSNKSEDRKPADLIKSEFESREQRTIKDNGRRGRWNRKLSYIIISGKWPVEWGEGIRWQTQFCNSLIYHHSKGIRIFHFLVLLASLLKKSPKLQDFAQHADNNVSGFTVLNTKSVASYESLHEITELLQEVEFFGVKQKCKLKSWYR